MGAGTRPRLGLMAYSSNTGLGVQTLEFAEHLHPDRVLLVDLSRYNHTVQHPERYAAYDCVPCKGFPTVSHITRFIRGLDVVFVCETPLSYDLFAMCRKAGVKTILQPNHEFNDYYQRPNLPLPDLFALPSMWHYDDLPYRNKRYLPVPIATERMQQRESKSIRRFLHVAGRPAIHDRNGTLETIAAFRQLKNPAATLTVRVQGGGREYLEAAGSDHRISVDSSDVLSYWELYGGFDCLILPRKYGGTSLPMQEALGCGIPVIMTNVNPNDLILPPEWLVPAERTGEFMTRAMIDIHTADVKALAAKLREFCTMDAGQVKAAFEQARRTADRFSWVRMKPEYLDAIEEAVGV